MVTAQLGSRSPVWTWMAVYRVHLVSVPVLVLVPVLGLAPILVAMRADFPGRR